MKEAIVEEAIEFVRSADFESKSEERELERYFNADAIEAIGLMAEWFAEKFALDNDRAWSAACHYLLRRILEDPKADRLAELLERAGS